MTEQEQAVYDLALRERVMDIRRQEENISIFGKEEDSKILNGPYHVYGTERI